jgi:putative ATP-dependent endonuclease of OLD family
MLIRRLTIENVRSILDRREMLFGEGSISILIGPNGGGKTNLLDALVIMLRRYVFNAPYHRHSPTQDEPDRWEEAYNDALTSLFFEKHSRGLALPQFVEIELEVSAFDLQNMKLIQADAAQIKAKMKRKFNTDPWAGVNEWDVSGLEPGRRVMVRWDGNSIVPQEDKSARDYLSYLHVFETDNRFRSELGMAPLSLPMVYLPVNRAAGGFNSAVGLSGYNDYDQKRSTDATSSRTGTNIIPLAIGRLARKFRLLQEQSNVEAREKFYEDKHLIELADDLEALGYTWSLETIDPLSNTYDVRLTKQGSSFLVSAASSGERELLTYLFAIHALNVRNALIIVDEPELHLHPRWQMALFSLFEKLSKTTGNQFVLATHSPTFISPASIQYVSRVYSDSQKSNIIRLNSTELPNAKHLFNIINSQNNERVFFTDKVLLVEGLHDRIVFEKMLEVAAHKAGKKGVLSLEVVSVGGKGLFAAYQQLLDACKVDWIVISDLDYVEQIGTRDIKELFSTDLVEIKKDVIDNVKSIDGDTLYLRIDEAMKNGNWGDAVNVWEYIKSKRRKLKPNLSSTEQEQLNAFIAEKEAEGIFILGRGTLEDYLPAGYRAKDTERLIELVSADDFLDRLPKAPRDEIDRIARTVLGIV